MIKGLLIDLHGTLAFWKKRFEPEEICGLLRKHGHDVYFQQWEAARKYVSMVEYCRGGINTREQYIRRTLELLGMKIDDRTLKIVSDFYAKNRVFEFFDDVKFIKELKIKKAIVTTIPIFEFDYLDLSWADLIITGREAGTAKPHPNVYLTPIKKWGLAPKDVLFVSDEIECDVEPATKLGIKSVLIDRENKYAGTGYAKISSLEEVKGILQKS